MERYAQLDGDTIVQVIESETDPDGINGQWVACGDAAGPGWIRPGVDLPFEPPAPIPAPRELAKIDFLKRFTQAERMAIRAAGRSNPEVEDYIELMNAATVVHRDDPDMVRGITLMEAAGVLAAGRAAQILA